MSNIIGKLFNKSNPDSFDDDIYEGEISTLKMHLRLKLHPNKEGHGSNAPKYLIAVISDTGNEIKVGGAWLKQKTQMTGGSFEFLSMTLDDPSFPHPLYLYAFLDADKNYDVKWSRQKNRAED